MLHDGSRRCLLPGLVLMAALALATSPFWSTLWGRQRSILLLLPVMFLVVACSYWMAHKISGQPWWGSISSSLGQAFMTTILAGLAGTGTMAVADLLGMGIPLLTHFHKISLLAILLAGSAHMATTLTTIWRQGPLDNRRTPWLHPSPLQHWLPPARLPGHHGGSLPEDLVFCHAPPEAIGTLHSAWSWLRQDDAILPPTTHTLMRLILAFGGLMVGYLAGHNLFVPASPLMDFTMAITMATLLVKHGEKLASLPALVSFVGENGVALWEQKEYPHGPQQENFFTFDQVDAFYEQVTHHHINTSYNHRSCNLLWYGGNRVLLSLNDGTYNNNKPPNPHSQRALANACRQAWLRYRLPRLLAEARDSGSCRLPLKYGGFLELAPGSLTLEKGNKRFSFPAHTPWRLWFRPGEVVLENSATKQRQVIPAAEISDVACLPDLLALFSPTATLSSSP